MSDLMISRITEVHNFFKEYVFGFMFHDIEAAITGRANFLAALGLMDYTEILGGFVTGKLKEKEREARNNFEAFLPFLGKWYTDLDDQLKGKGGIYSRVRCGLAHEYFIKGKEKTVYMSHPEKPDAKGITYLSDVDRLEFVVTKFYADFKSAAEVYHGQLVYEKNVNLLDNFFKAKPI